MSSVMGTADGEFASTGFIGRCQRSTPCATRANSRMLYNTYIRSLGESGSMRLIRLLAALLIFGAAAQAQGFPPGRPAQLPPDTPAPPPHTVAPAQAGQQQTATTPVGQQQNPAAPNQGLPQSQAV